MYDAVARVQYPLYSEAFYCCMSALGESDMKIALPFDTLDGCNPQRLMEWQDGAAGIQ